MTTVNVFIANGGDTVFVGQAHFTRGRRNVSTTFVYDAAYLTSGGINIDPALQLTTGPQHQPAMLRAFSDTAPDRWGRNLLDKAERARARAEKRTPRSLGDIEYLIGVSDDTRQGALRFRLPGHEEFLAERSKVPQLISLPRLLRASDELAADNDSAAAIKQLLDTGTTGLGGARPKASILLEDQSLAIAKFPHSADQWDAMAWESTALDLLEGAGIRTPQRRLTRVGDRSVLLLRRFDRTDASPSARIPYISAMTATGSDDGDHLDYADIAVAVRDLTNSPRDNLADLYARVVANVALGNTDDHLRNHGFLSSRGSWTLSPAFDVNPTPNLDRTRATSIAGADAFPDEVDGLLGLAADCNLTLAQAKSTMGRIAASMSGWRSTARHNGAPVHEIGLMAESIEPRLEAITTASHA